MKHEMVTGAVSGSSWCAMCNCVEAELTTNCIGRKTTTQERYYLREGRLDFNGEVWLVDIEGETYRVQESPILVELDTSAVAVATIHRIGKITGKSAQQLEQAFAELARSTSEGMKAFSIALREAEFELKAIEKPKPFWQRLRGRWAK